MSINNSQRFETQPAMNAVSDDVVLPVIESSVISRTKQQYADMTFDQRHDFWLAVTATAGGVALTATALAIETYRPESTLPIKLRATAYALDYADGYFAKRSATLVDKGAVTELGAIADPLADKINNTLNEIALVRGGQLRPSDLAIRALRDASVTAARRFVTKKAKGRVDVKANKLGKLNTVLRDGVNLFASSRMASEHRTANRALQTTANIYSLGSGAYTTTQLFAAYRKETSQ